MLWATFNPALPLLCGIGLQVELANEHDKALWLEEEAERA